MLNKWIFSQLHGKKMIAKVAKAIVQNLQIGNFASITPCDVILAKTFAILRNKNSWTCECYFN